MDWLKSCRLFHLRLATISSHWYRIYSKFLLYDLRPFYSSCMRPCWVKTTAAGTILTPDRQAGDRLGEECLVLLSSGCLRLQPEASHDCVSLIKYFFFRVASISLVYTVWTFSSPLGPCLFLPPEMAAGWMVTSSSHLQLRGTPGFIFGCCSNCIPNTRHTWDKIEYNILLWKGKFSLFWWGIVCGGHRWMIHCLQEV